ncbi:MAG: histidine kinase N-terminal 7TM domain-containing protein [Desulfobacteraceae bacterium]
MPAIDQPYAFMLVFAALTPAVLTVSILRHRPTLGVRSFSTLMAAVSLWALTALCEVWLQDPQTKIFSYKIKFLFIVMVPASWLAFSLYHSNRIHRLDKKWLGALTAMPLLTLVIVGTNGYHHWMFGEFSLVKVGRHLLVKPSFGPFFWVHATYSYLVLLAGFVLLTKHLIDSPAPRRRQVVSLMIGGIAPWISNIFYIFTIGDRANFDYTPVAFTISGIAFMWGILRYKLLDIVPIARDLVIQNMYDGVIVVDNDEIIIDINHTARRLSGGGRTNVIGMRADKGIAWWRTFKQHFLFGHHAQLPILERNVGDRTHLLQMTCAPILVDDKPLGHVITLHDVTAAQTAQHALQESEARFKSLSENAPVIIFSLDINGTLDYVNPAWESLLGYSRSEVAGRPFAEFIQPENDTDIGDIFQCLISGQSPVAELNLRVIHKDGSQRLFNTSASANSNINGQVIGIIGLAKDVTEEYRLQHQLFESQKMEAIGTLAGGIAHDFNNLLMGMQANLSLMRLETAHTASLQEKIRRIEEQIQNGASLTRQLLGYARKGKYALRVFDINTLIRDTLSVVSRTNKGVVIVQHLSSQPAFIKADQGQIELVLLNLFINAVDAMPEGGELSVTSTHIKATEESGGLTDRNEGPFIQLAIRDTGIGMDQNTQARIFEPFFTTKEMGRGTGLGLASVYGVIKNHGGSIQVESFPGRGATFTLTVPATRAERPARSIPAKKAILPPKGGTILIVDDEPLILQYCQEMIKSLGFSVFSAATAEEAIHIYQKYNRDIDIAILDMVMPKMNGLQLFGALQAINPEIRTIITTGYALDSRISEIIVKNSHQYLKKPYTRDQLANSIANLMDKEQPANARANAGAV